MRMEAGLDTGPVYLREAIRIAPDDTAQSLHDKLAILGGRCVVQALAGIEAGSLMPVAQPTEGVTYAQKIDKHEAELDWYRNAAELDRQIRAFIPFPVAQTHLRGEVVRISRASVLEGPAGTPGVVAAVTDAGILVPCGTGVATLGGVAARRRQALAGTRIPAWLRRRRGGTLRVLISSSVIVIQRRAASALLQVLRGQSLTAALAALWKRHPGLPASERAAIQDLSFGTCRRLGTLRALLHSLANKPLADPELEALLLVALYQLEWTRAAPHAVVDFSVRTCAALGKGSAKGLVNAVLRSFLRDRATLLVHARASEVGRFSYPQWWIDELKRAYPDRYADDPGQPATCIRR